MSDRPPIRYAPVDGGYIAYQRFGEGALNLAYVSPLVSNLDVWWDYAPATAYLRRWGAFSRLLMHDRRGTGMSDAEGQPNLETRVADLAAVLDDAGVEQTTLYGVYEGGMVAALFAATYPDRTNALIWYSATARVADAPDHPWGMTPAEIDEVVDVAAATWGSEEHAVESLRHAGVDPDDLPGLAAFQARMNRLSCGPAAAREYYRIMSECDVRSVLPAIRAPVLIIDRASFDDRERAESEDVVSRIPDAVLDRLPAGPKSALIDPEPLLASARSFLGVAEPREPSNTVLATVLFTDIVDSTRLQARDGDHRWKDLAEQHHAVIRAELERFGGIEQDTAGDGFYARFDGPARAIGCALAATEAVRSLGIEIRAGIHTGECEIVNGKVGGLNVSIGARILAKSDASHVLVSQTVKDLVAGSGLAFEDAGEHELKGIPDRWRLYRVVS